MYEEAYNVGLYDAEKERRRARYEQRIGAVHLRRNKKDRKREAQRSNLKRGNKQAWLKEQLA